MGCLELEKEKRRCGRGVVNSDESAGRGEWRIEVETVSLLNPKHFRHNPSYTILQLPYTFLNRLPDPLSIIITTLLPMRACYRIMMLQQTNSLMQPVPIQLIVKVE